MEPIQRKLKDEQRVIKIREKKIEADDDLLFEDAQENTSQLTTTDSEEKSSVVGLVRANSEILGDHDTILTTAETESRKQIEEMVLLYEKQFEKMQVSPINQESSH
jgi:hypothetical protein